jgi:hypothetical protein
MTRTSAYRFTVRMVNGQVAPEDQAAVDGLRTVVKLGNLAYDSAPRYVKLQGRGPRPSHRYHQSLPLSMATTADVYVYIR